MHVRITRCAAHALDRHPTVTGSQPEDAAGHTLEQWQDPDETS